MAIALRFEHVDGIRLRQQMAQKTERNKDGVISLGTEWRFEKAPGSREDAEVPRDVDQRTKEPTSTYSPTINYGLKNLIVERKGPIVHLQFRNSSVRNQLRIKVQSLTSTGKKGSDGVEIKKWQDSGPVQYLAPQMWGGVAVGDGVRAILDEMPT